MRRRPSLCDLPPLGETTSPDGNGNTTQLSYDGFDRARETEYADGLTEGYRYDENGNITRADANLNATYDAQNRNVTQAAPRNPNADPVDHTCGYDLVGRLLQVHG